MLKLFKNRFFIFGLICFLGFGVLIFRLAETTIIMGDYFYEMSLERKTVEMQLRGSRGNILDRNGIPLAINRQIFAVQLDRRKMPSNSQQINKALHTLIQILETNGEKAALADNLPIKIGENGNIYYEWYDKDSDVQKRRFDRWRENASIETELPAAAMLKHLRDRYRIDGGISDVMARNIISIRLDVFMNRFTPGSVRVATDLSHAAISQIEMNSEQLMGVQTIVEAVRYYPWGDVAAHVIGYVGRIDEGNVDEYRAAGYDPAIDRIGKKGIEAYAENWLTAGITERHGQMLAEVDSKGRAIRVLRETPPQNGNDVMLTLDIALQKAAEDILEQEISNMRALLPPYDHVDRQAPDASRGAAVIMNVRTGELLALASYPSFDLNWFIPRLSPENYNRIVENDALTAIAFQERFAPGSIFKMLIGVAGLMEGKLAIDERIYDEDEFIRYGWGRDTAPECWAEPGVHGYEDIVDAIMRSCNYFFYEVADRLGIGAINKWADIFGINGNTGLEIGDVESSAGGPHKRATGRRIDVTRAIRDLLMQYVPEFSGVEEAIREEHVNDIASISYTTTLQEIRRIIREDLRYLDEDANREVLAELSERIRFDVLMHYKRWTPWDTVMTGTGQADTQITPLNAARYVAALSNGGMVLSPRVLKAKISSGGEVEYMQTQVEGMAQVDEQYLQAIKLGMYRAVADASTAGGGQGTAVTAFSGIDPGITLGAKTGTAQTVAGRPQRNTAWFISFTPFENPEVAVVVTIPNGTSSGNASVVARKIIEEYYRINEQREQFKIIDVPNRLQPGY